MHLLDAIEDVMPDEGGLTAAEIASRLGKEGKAVAVICPESVETYERDGETVMLVRGGEHRALSPIAIDKRLNKHMSGFKKKGQTWHWDENMAADMLEGVL